MALPEASAFTRQNPRRPWYVHEGDHLPFRAETTTAGVALRARYGGELLTVVPLLGGRRFHRRAHTRGMDEVDLQRLRDVFARYPEVAGVWLFGSHAQGAASTRSDVDLAVDPVDPVSGAARARKLDMLTDLVQEGYDDVDLVVLDGDDPVLRFEAIKHNVVVYAAPGYDPAEAFVQALEILERLARTPWERFASDPEKRP